MTTPDETTEHPSMPSDPLLGELIGGKYRVLGHLASGGMARIYRAEQEPLGRVVALKALSPANGGGTDDEGARFEDRFFLEASTCAKLKHPNTVTLFDFGHHVKTNTFYMIMELVEGRSLSEVIKQEKRIHPVRALTIGIEICRSLQEAHQLGIVHRDLKPSNVMVVDTLEGEGVKVLDFGIAKVLQADSQSITMEDRIVGSPRYMSPEQITQGPIDARTDIYALGVMLWEMIVGVAPFKGRTAIQTLMKHVNSKPPRASERLPEFPIPPELDELLLQCMAKEPAERPGSIDQLKQLLRATLAIVADTTDDVRLSTSSVVRQALEAQPQVAALEHSQPTLNRLPTQESTITRATPVVIGGITLFGVIGALGLGFVLLGLGALAWTGALGPGPTQIEVPLPVDGTAPAPAPAPATPQAAPTLTLTSVPPGAVVTEDDVVLGNTPLTVQLDPERPDARLFVLALEGFETWEHEQPATRADVEVVAQLKEVPAVAPKPAPAPARPRPAPTPDPDLDIIDER